MPNGVLIAALVFVTWATINDLMTREISNWPIVGIFIIGILFNIYNGTWIMMLYSFIFPTILSLVLFKFGAFGGGDLKLLIALSTLMGISWSFGMFFYSLLASLPVTIFYLVKEKTWKPSIPYALPILIGCIWQYLTPLV